jgi:hypothetical protein
MQDTIDECASNQQDRMVSLMLLLIRERLLEVVQAVAPLTIFVTLLQFTIVHAPQSVFAQYLVGSALAILGMTFLLAGIEYGILPMGRFIGAALPSKESMWLIAVVSFVLGLATTIAEPDVLVLAGQVDQASHGGISRQTVVYVVGVGVGVFAVIAMIRIVAGWQMKYLLGAVYLATILLSFFAPEQFVSLAFDAGSVTTGVLSAPVLIAIAIGLSSVLAGRSAASDGFGLLGFASVGPIIALLLIGHAFQ